MFLQGVRLQRVVGRDTGTWKSVKALGIDLVRFCFSLASRVWLCCKDSILNRGYLPHGLLESTNAVRVGTRGGCATEKGHEVRVFLRRASHLC